MDDCIDAPPPRNAAPISASEFAARRLRLIEQLQPDSLAIVVAAPEQVRNNDAHYPYRQDSSFYYLTGFKEPEAIAVFISGKSSRYILFNRVRDPAKEIWNGVRAGQAGARTQYGADEAYPIDEFESVMSKMLMQSRSVYWALAADPVFDRRMFSMVNALRAKVRSGVAIPTVFLDVMPIINEMRLIKSPAEIALMREACDISARGHYRAMKMCRAGRYEYELEAELLHEFTRAGSRAPAYTSIVGAGANSCVLHYVENTAVLCDGDLVLIDAGCEYDLYAADITRTFPVNGRFTQEQRAIYDLVLAAQTAAISQIKPGLPWPRLQEIIVQCLTEGLVSLGILHGDIPDLIATQAYQCVYMHNSGHWLGLDVHDVGDYRHQGTSRLLEAGMVLTVEPGIYIAAHTPGIDPKWWNIGVRIEDDVLVTNQGYDILSKNLPKQAIEIEAIMAAS